MSALFRNPNIKRTPIAEAVYQVYAAKRTAELNRDVGKETDMAVLVASQDAQFLSKEAISRLEAIYDSKEPPRLTKSEADSIQALLPRTAKYD